MTKTKLKSNYKQQLFYYLVAPLTLEQEQCLNSAICCHAPQWWEIDNFSCQNLHNPGIPSVMSLCVKKYQSVLVSRQKNFHFKTRHLIWEEREGNLTQQENDAHVVNGRDKLHAANFGVTPYHATNGGNLGWQTRTTLTSYISSSRDKMMKPIRLRID